METYDSNETHPGIPPVPADSPAPGLPVKRAAWTVTLTWESILWMILGAAALATRLLHLGARVMSHDESLHVFYSWQLATGKGYVHNPMMHGPFLFEATALFDAIFGANDFTSRLAPVLLGIFIAVGAPLLLRPWMGRIGALCTSLFFLVSPYVLFYSRYDRHDIQVIAWVLVAAFAILEYLRERREGSLLLLAGALGLMLSTMEISFIYLAIFASFLAVRIIALHGLRLKEWFHTAEWDALIVLATLGAFFSSAIALVLLNPLWTRLTGQPYVDLAVLGNYGTPWYSTPEAPHLWILMGIFWVASVLLGFFWDLKRWWKLAAVFLAIAIPLYSTFFTNWGGLGTGFVGSLGYWLSQQGVARGSQPGYYYLIVFPLYEFLPLIAGTVGLAFYALRWRRLSDAERIFVPFAGWWAVLIFLGLSFAGEKMPWLSTHITIPFILLAGWFAGHTVKAARHFDEEGNLAVSPAALAGSALIVLLLLVTARASYLVNYVNYDYTTEFVGYAHSAPGVKWAMEDIERINNSLGAGQKMTVAYDSQVSWPMSWYLRDYPGFYGDSPNRASVENAPVILAGTTNWQKVESYVGGKYSRYEVIRMWWPMEDYKGLNWERIRGALVDPQMRKALWDIFWSRDYHLYGVLTRQDLNPPQRWPLEDRMRVYVRKDLAPLVVSLKNSQIEDLPTLEETFGGQQLDVAPSRVLEPGLSLPRGVAAGTDGSTYVVDTGNSRVVKLSPSGEAQASFGSRTPDGQVPPAEGTFNEPWGIALDGQGNVYVADTWNHRIQKFDSAGRFLLQWGTGGLRADGPDRFWGPRGIAISTDGLIYVTDTGNRRVAVFDATGQFQFDFDTQGDGQLDEPVGIAVGPDGRINVADTWNRRVAVFSPDGKFQAGWPVAGWPSTSVDNKPYLAVDAQGRVFLTDPEGFRVLVYEKDGTPLAAFGQFGTEVGGLNLPTGLAFDPDGNLLIADAGNNRVDIYPPITP